MDSTGEHAIILAASLADRGMHAGRAVGLVSHTLLDEEDEREEMIWLPPQMSDHHRWEMLRALALVEAGTRSLADLLNLAGPTLGQHTSLILITPNIDLDWLEAVLLLRRKGIVPTVLLFDPGTFGGEGNTATAQASLSSYGIAHEIIPRELLDRQEARPGREGHWGWRVTPLGKTIHVQRPVDLTWRELAG
jgi:uncharacterized protein (DUF58 family)